MDVRRIVFADGAARVLKRDLGLGPRRLTSRASSSVPQPSSQAARTSFSNRCAMRVAVPRPLMAWMGMMASDMAFNMEWGGKSSN
jgi:hypothetical protein